MTIEQYIMKQYNGQRTEKSLLIITIFPPDVQVLLVQMHQKSIVWELVYLLNDGAIDHEEKVPRWFPT